MKQKQKQKRNRNRNKEVAKKSSEAFTFAKWVKFSSERKLKI